MCEKLNKMFLSLCEMCLEQKCTVDILASGYMQVTDFYSAYLHNKDIYRRNGSKTLVFKSGSIIRFGTFESLLNLERDILYIYERLPNIQAYELEKHTKDIVIIQKF